MTEEDPVFALGEQPPDASPAPKRQRRRDPMAVAAIVGASLARRLRPFVETSTEVRRHADRERRRREG